MDFDLRVALSSLGNISDISLSICDGRGHLRNLTQLVLQEVKQSLLRCGTLDDLIDKELVERVVCLFLIVSYLLNEVVCLLLPKSYVEVVVDDLDLDLCCPLDFHQILDVGLIEKGDVDTLLPSPPSPA